MRSVEKATICIFWLVKSCVINSYTASPAGIAENPLISRSQASRSGCLDTVCFHCQQFVEKLLKALLTCHRVEAPKTHDLRRLIQLAEPFAPELSRFSDASDVLTAHGLETRYPDDWPSGSDKSCASRQGCTSSHRAVC